MAGELGFEPRLTESESAVLPLNYSPTILMLHQCLVAAVFQIIGHGFPNSGSRGPKYAGDFVPCLVPTYYLMTLSRACPPAATSI
jgi:hypothetical protein